MEKHTSKGYLCFSGLRKAFFFHFQQANYSYFGADTQLRKALSEIGRDDLCSLLDGEFDDDKLAEDHHRSNDESSDASGKYWQSTNTGCALLYVL